MAKEKWAKHMNGLFTKHEKHMACKHMERSTPWNDKIQVQSFSAVFFMIEQKQRKCLSLAEWLNTFSFICARVYL